MIDEPPAANDIDLIEVKTRELFKKTFSAWANRDLEQALTTLSDDVVHVLNVDGAVAPFAASVAGKSNLREKLQLILDTFDFSAFVTDYLVVEQNVARARMKIIFDHKATGERLKTNFSFVVTQRNDQIVRIEEHHDAAYVEAFARLISSGAKC